jgi:SAM-dependent methyltransferase
VNEAKQNVYGGPYHWYMPPFFDYMHRSPLDLLFEAAPPSSRVLDVGAGDARLTHFLARRFRAVIGVESQADIVQLGRLMTRLQGTSPALLCGDATKLPFASGSFDVVTSFDVIEHVPLDVAGVLLAEAFRVLRPGGCLLVTTPNSRSLRNRVLGHHPDPKHYFEFAAGELVQAVRDARFTAIRLEGRYIPPPLPRIEHFASVFPFRGLFRALVRAGRRYPSLSDKLVVLAAKPQEPSC